MLTKRLRILYHEFIDCQLKYGVPIYTIWVWIIYFPRGEFALEVFRRAFINGLPFLYSYSYFNMPVLLKYFLNSLLSGQKKSPESVILLQCQYSKTYVE